MGWAEPPTTAATAVAVCRALMPSMALCFKFRPCNALGRVIDNDGASDAICAAFRCPDEGCRELVLKMLSVFAASPNPRGLPRVLAAWEAHRVRWKEPVRYGMLVDLLGAPSAVPEAGAGRRTSSALHR